MQRIRKEQRVQQLIRELMPCPAGFSWDYCVAAPITAKAVLTISAQTTPDCVTCDQARRRGGG